MGDEMLSVFYSGDIFTRHGKISAREVANLTASFDEKSEFRLFRDYFGLIRLVQNAAELDNTEPGFDSLYDFTYTKRSRVDSVGSDHSLTSSSSGGNAEIELFVETPSKAPGTSLAPGAPTRVSKRNAENNSEVANRNRKNRESKKNRNANVCVFCRNNGESKKVYSSHVLKDAEGNTTCPILRAYTCPLCKASGNESHTIKYCPKNKNTTKQQQSQTTASQGLN
ncbi:unnamed protein product [Porites evermanni]|uniref:Nanos-type domain-containing protein n=1 Tax=Porites evermanni TaxID=104178 RepID=A0ABN8SQQ6_9CNID|nr:unnamed protein product [Porites evermanni]